MAPSTLHHLSLEVGDLERTRFFYDRFLVPLGFRRFTQGPAYLGYTDGTVTVWLLKGRTPRIRRHPPVGDEEVIAEHLAFRLPSAAAVKAREGALAAAELYPFFPGEEHPEFRPGYFSATWVDPDGIALEIYAVPEGRAKTPRPRRRTSRTRARPTRARRAGRRARAAR
jgi:catechol 2,3-dioxygenase-like lactoylglutathione lyase family enzyme